jgi:hypothetical protein
MKFYGYISSNTILLIIFTIIYLLIILSIYTYRSGLKEKWILSIVKRSMVNETIRRYINEYENNSYKELIIKIVDDEKTYSKDEILAKYREIVRNSNEIKGKLHEDLKNEI